MSVHAQLFENPLKKHIEILESLNQSFPEHVVDEIHGYVIEKSNQKFDLLVSTIAERFHKVDALFDTLSDNRSNDEVKVFLQQYFELTNPSELAKDLKLHLEFGEIRYDYIAFIKSFSKESYGELFFRYQFDHDVFSFLEALLLEKLESVSIKLNDFSKKMTAHFLMLKDIQTSKKAKTIVKTIASGAGLSMGIPLMGLAAGKVLHEDYSAKIYRSLDEVDDFFSVYRKQLEEFFISLQKRYDYILMSLYGGTFLQLKKQFAVLNLEILSINLMEYTYDLGLINEGRNRVLKWSGEAFSSIKDLLMINNLRDASVIANRLYHTVEQNPLLKTVQVEKNKSLIYMANLYKFAVLSRQAEEIHQKDSILFLHFTAELFHQMFYLVHGEDMEGLVAQKPFELVSKFISESMKSEMILEDKKLLWNKLLGNYENLIKRSKSKNTMFFAGEFQNNFDDDPYHLQIMKCFSYYIDENFKEPTFISKHFSFQLPAPPVLRKIAKSYKKVAGRDKFYNFMLLGRALQIGVVPIRILARLFVRPKRTAYVTLVLLMILSGVYLNKSNRISFDFDFLANFVPGNETIASEGPDFFRVNVEVANIRSAPDLNSDIVDSVYMHQKFFVIDEISDSEGRLWFNVCSMAQYVDDACLSEYWISSKVVDQGFE